MKFIPILFSTPMVQAILEGRKTQARREVNFCEVWPDLLEDLHKKLEVKGKEVFNLAGEHQFNLRDRFGKPGDVLWVRECFYPATNAPFIYKADGWVGDKTWKPSIHMPKSACRIFLEVVSVRVERLQDISEADAKQEGISIVDQNPVSIYNNYVFNVKNAMWPGYGSITKTYGFTNPKDSFHSLWESINGHQSWVVNPWVWVVEFKRIEKPENFK